MFLLELHGTMIEYYPKASQTVRVMLKACGRYNRYQATVYQKWMKLKRAVEVDTEKEPG